MNTKVIYENCNVISEIFKPVHAIFFYDGQEGYADIEDEDGTFMEFSCDSRKEFEEIVERF